VISSPAKYGDFKQELIAEIHRKFVWPIVVNVDGNISKPNNTDLIERFDSYIVLTPDGNIESFKAEFTTLYRDRNKSERFWHSDTRFVVAGAYEFSMSQQTDIFNYLSKLGIYNCIIVSREHYILVKEHRRRITFNAVDTGMKLGVYTWFPYKSSDHCTEVNDITLLDSWDISAQGHFTKNTDLFPRKISKSLKGCPMKAVVRNCYWTFTTRYIKQWDSNGRYVIYITGLEMDLLSLVLKEMNMTFIHIPTPNNFECDMEMTNNLITAMIAKEVYIAVGYLGTRYLSDPLLDSTNSHYTMSIRWYVPCSFKNPRWSSIFRILSEELWIVLIISIVIVAISTTLVGRYSCTSEWQGYKTLTSSLTNVWAVILGVAVSTMPRTPSLRSLFFAWACFSVVFNTVFEAFFTTFLIEPGYKTSIQNMDELQASGIQLAYAPEYSSFFENDDETKISNLKRNLLNCPSYDDCWEWVKKQKSVSVLLEDKIAEIHFAAGNIIGENSEPLLCGLEDGVNYKYGQSFVMLHADPLIGRVSEIIDRVVEAGLYNHWNSLNMNWLKFYSRKIGIVHPFDGYYSFNLYHMQPAFYLILMGWFLSALCFMIELIMQKV
jgi:hypothetical protein